MVSLLGILIFFLPLGLSPASFVEPDTLLTFFYSFLLLAFSALWIVLKGLPLEKLRPVKYPLFFFAFFLALATAFSANRLRGLEEFCKYATGLVLFLLAASLSEEEKERLAPGLVLAAVLISFLAIFQYFFGFQILRDYVVSANIADPFVMEKIAQRRVFFPFPTPAVLGGYLAMILPLTLSLPKRLLYLLPLAFALLLTRSLGALLSLAVVFAAFFLTRVRSGRKKILALLVLVLIIGGVFALRTYNPKENLRPVFSVVSRLDYWKDAWEIIRAHPLTGAGLGNFNLPGSRYAHNAFLQLWAEGGIGALVSFLWLVAVIFKNSLRSSAGKLTAGLAAGVCVFLVHNLMDFGFYLPAVSFVWWVMLGLFYFPAPQGERKTPSGTPAKV